MNRYNDSPDFASNNSLLPPIKRVAAVHDISCLGRCALTVIIPVLSAMGIQTVPLPTALLSTHTGGFDNMFFEDLTRHMGEISAHWKSIGTDFDAIYSGFLGSHEQIDTLLSFIRDFARKNDGRKAFIAIDPVMGDDGELYSTYNDELMHGMSHLCVGADLITPNLTEACFLTGEKYPAHVPTEKEAKEFAGYLAKKLVDKFGCKKAVVTGSQADGGGNKILISTAIDAENEGSEPFYHSVPLMPRSYPGTGDVFASVLLGMLLDGRDFADSVRFASDYVCKVTEFSHRYATPIRDGLVIEPCLSLLAHPQD